MQEPFQQKEPHLRPLLARGCDQDSVALTISQPHRSPPICATNLACSLVWNYTEPILIPSSQSNLR